jgi:hypothetical protein
MKNAYLTQKASHLFSNGELINILLFSLDIVMAANDQGKIYFFDVKLNLAKEITIPSIAYSDFGFFKKEGFFGFFLPTKELFLLLMKIRLFKIK